MEPFTSVSAVAVPLDAVNIDTDRVIPARFLHRPRGPEYAGLLFHDVRFDEDGRERADFIMNQPAFREARVIVAADNFGCGSSREHAVWALAAYGIRVVIAPSFGDIFFNNCFKVGVLPVVVPGETAAALRRQLHAMPGASITVDLESQTLTGPDGARIPFTARTRSRSPWGTRRPSRSSSVATRTRSHGSPSSGTHEDAALGLSALQPRRSSRRVRAR
jgi:3-isopropylmalate/(R)-2-methylmalate dehydratase small subunit